MNRLNCPHPGALASTERMSSLSPETQARPLTPCGVSNQLYPVFNITPLGSGSNDEKNEACGSLPAARSTLLSSLSSICVNARFQAHAFRRTLLQGRAFTGRDVGSDRLAPPPGRKECACIGSKRLEQGSSRAHHRWVLQSPETSPLIRRRRARCHCGDPGIGSDTTMNRCPPHIGHVGCGVTAFGMGSVWRYSPAHEHALHLHSCGMKLSIISNSRKSMNRANV